MASAISGLPSTPTPTTTGGTKALTSGDFMNLMIQQLSQQDPLNPTDSNQLLTQMSQISNLQSNTDMQASLSGLTLQQSIGAGGNLIGKTISGLDSTGSSVQGIVTSVKVADKKVYLELDSGKTLPMSNVTQIAPSSATALSNATTSDSQLAAILKALSALGGSTPTSTTPAATAAGATATPAVISTPAAATRSNLGATINALIGATQ